jgi:hypothetical protein
MKKGTLPTGTNRKRWIERLPEEVYQNLKPKDKENLHRFHDYSKQRESKIVTIKNLRTKIKDLKEEIKLLDEKEESNYIKIQFLHNTYGCRIDLTRQEKKSKSLKNDTHTYGGTLGFDGTVGSQPYTYSKTYIKKTYKGEKLVPHYVYHGKIISKSLEKSKTCYFQEEKRLIQTIKELSGTDLSKSKNPMEGIKKVLIPLYKDYIIHLMVKMGSDKFEGFSVKFPDFIKWCKKIKKNEINSFYSGN